MHLRESGRKSKLLGVALVAVLVTAGLVVAVNPIILGPSKVNPRGPVRIALEGDGARWNSFVQIFDGSFSAQLTASGTGDASKVDLSPLNIPLARLTEAGITFWAYFEHTNDFVPRVDFVLDNGRRLEGYRNTAPSALLPADKAPGDYGIGCESTDNGDGDCQGYASSDLWTLMAVTPCPVAGTECGFYSSVAVADPLIDDDWILAGAEGPQNIAAWVADPDFASAKVVQMRIAYGDDNGAADTMYVDDVRIGGRFIKIEPESASTGTA
jgi:hypothetical protein